MSSPELLTVSLSVAQLYEGDGLLAPSRWMGFVERIEEKLLSLGMRELPSARIGELLMRELKKLDKVAYVRFASVYRGFEDIDEFKTLVDEVRR